jgi:hypothetical protein
MSLPFRYSYLSGGVYHGVVLTVPLTCFMYFLDGTRVDMVPQPTGAHFDCCTTAGGWYHFFDQELDPLLFSVYFSGRTTNM